MKKINFLTCVILSLFTIVSCSKDQVYDIIIDKHIIIIQDEGGKESVKVQTNGSWSVMIEESAKDWIKVNFDNSDLLSADLEIIVDSPNNGTEKRVGIIYIKNGDNTREVTVTQEFNIDVNIEHVYGKWHLTECKEAPMMLGSEFTFNDDKTCIAKLTMMGGKEVKGNYELKGNIIDIISEGRIITIAVNEIVDTKSMTAVVMGQYKSVLNKIE